jgi:hypothetical protein
MRRLGFALLALIAVFSLLPGPWKGRTATHGGAHHAAHIAAFATTSFLLSRSRRTAASQVAQVACLVLFGMVLEALQVAAFGNRIEYPDVMDDAVGVLLGLVAGRLVLSRE